MAEWSNALVLKTSVQQCTGGSNPSLSAKEKPYHLIGLFRLKKIVNIITYYIFSIFKKMKLSFRIIAFLEGVSYILLMTFGLYFKYRLNDDSFVKLLGMPHGILFILYIIFAFLLRKKENWNILNFGIILFASLIPFGTFYIDRKYL
tara:strand:+ start:280 stop:720 length:441 start_codon:yes stop_codon:yes gene_type:complete